MTSSKRLKKARTERHSVGQRAKGKSSEGGEDGEGVGDSAGDSDSEQYLRCTEEHPFWVEGQGWVNAKDLRQGDQLRGSNGEELEVSGHEIKDEEADHYNFEVQDFHTYFVADGTYDDSPGIWVHNDCEGTIYDVAFGLVEHPTHVQRVHGSGINQPILKPFVRKMNRAPRAVSGRKVIDWRKNGFQRAGLIDPYSTGASQGTFEHTFKTVTNNAIDKGGRIKFVTQGIDIDNVTSNIDEVFGIGPKYASNNVTRWELASVLNDKKLYANTDFYDDNFKLIPRDQLESYGSGLIGDQI